MFSLLLFTTLQSATTTYAKNVKIINQKELQQLVIFKCQKSNVEAQNSA